MTQHVSLTESEARFLARQCEGDAVQNRDGEWGFLLDLSGPQDWSGPILFVSNLGDATYASRDLFHSGADPVSGYCAHTRRRYGIEVI